MTLRISETEYRAFTGKKKSPVPNSERRAFYTQKIAKRADKNQPEIVGILRGLGFMVHHLHEVGSGMFDLLCEKHGLNILVEVKDGEKPPSARALTPPQKRFNFAWRGMRCVVTCMEDCMRMDGQLSAIVRQLRQHNINTAITGSEERMYAPALY